MFNEGEGLLKDREDGLSERVVFELSLAWGRLGRRGFLVGGRKRWRNEATMCLRELDSEIGNWWGPQAKGSAQFHDALGSVGF